MSGAFGARYGNPPRSVQPVSKLNKKAPAADASVRSVHATAVTLNPRGGNMNNISLGPFDDVDDESTIALDQEVLHQLDTDSFETVRARVEEFTLYYKDKVLKDAVKLANVFIEACWACGDVGDIVVCFGCQARLCLTRAPTLSGCVLPIAGFDCNCFSSLQYEIIHTKYERYVFQKQCIPTAVITLNHGIRSAILRHLTYLTVAGEYRFSPSMLYWMDLTLAHNTLKGDKSHFFIIFDTHSDTSTGNLVFGGTPQKGFLSARTSEVMEAFIGPNFIDALPGMTGIKGCFFLTCSPLLSVSSSRLALEDLVKMNHFSYMIVFCSGSVVPSNVVLNLAKTITNSIVYPTDIFSAVETGFAANMRALIHTPIAVITKHTKHIVDNVSKKENPSTVDSNRSSSVSIDVASTPAISQSSLGAPSPSESTSTSKHTKMRYPIKSKASTATPSSTVPFAKYSSTTLSLFGLQAEFAPHLLSHEEGWKDIQHYWIPYPIPTLPYIWKTGEEHQVETTALQAAAKAVRKAAKRGRHFGCVHGDELVPMAVDVSRDDMDVID
ncbi:hypothetical protein JAAARDRAFT_193726 [Jaapia argillacea MUCL 33604]|uniref:Uncharacterized protein n=1 Tax=Jaapia argillacea MUCL 33604 TaxID=933084 RepID=A0A067Q1K5_9AGAM|nr:hypothetical protein JAAARDRAFT_193726 [Jaapia argillacea MUCL 33604]